MRLLSTFVKALFAEDYKPLQKSVSRAIRELDWAVDVASDGEEGKWFAQNHSYDVIVLDLDGAKPGVIMKGQPAAARPVS